MRINPYAVWLAICVLLLGCSQAPPPDVRVRNIGETVMAGAVAYEVTDAAWLDTLPAGNTPRLPKDSFLSIRLRIHNQSGREAVLPFLSVVDQAGNAMLETADGVIPGWLGMLRNVAVGETIEGQILFDVKPGAYNLRITDGGEEAIEKTALIAIPVPMPGANTMPPRR